MHIHVNVSAYRIAQNLQGSVKAQFEKGIYQVSRRADKSH